MVKWKKKREKRKRERERSGEKNEGKKGGKEMGRGTGAAMHSPTNAERRLTMASEIVWWGYLLHCSGIMGRALQWIVPIPSPLSTTASNDPQRRPSLPSPPQAACYKLLMMPSWALDPHALSPRCQPCPEREKERERERERIFWHGATEANPIFTSGYKSSGRKSPTEYRGANWREGRGDQKNHFCQVTNW